MRGDDCGGNGFVPVVPYASYDQTGSWPRSYRPEAT